MKISSKQKISDLYDQVSNLLGMNYHQLKLILIQANEKIILEDLNHYISDYQIKEGSAIFAQDINDPFSDMASSFASHLDPSEFLDTSANSVQQDQETLFQLIRLAMLSDIELFLEEREDKNQLINGTQISGWNAMHLICFLGDEKLYLWFLNSGGDVTILSKDGWNCLQIAIWQSHLKLIQLILGSNQIDINSITKKGSSLHIAAEIDEPEIIKLLLKHPKIDITIKHQGKNCLEIAGERTKNMLQKELLIFQNKQFDLINSFRSSLCSLYSLNSFYANKPEKPPIIKGFVKIVKYFKIILQENYLVCDPESGVLARYKEVTQYPMNPMYNLIYKFESLFRLIVLMKSRYQKIFGFKIKSYVTLKFNILISTFTWLSNQRVVHGNGLNLLKIQQVIIVTLIINFKYMKQRNKKRQSIKQ